MIERWLTYPEAAERAGVTERQVKTWRKDGLEGKVDERGRWLVEERALMDHARAQRWKRVRFSKTVQPKRRRDGAPG